jgi:hypothetical protein
LSYYIDNLNRSIAEHQRIIDAGLPESAEARQIIAQHQAEIRRVQNSAPSPAPAPQPSYSAPSYSAPAAYIAPTSTPAAPEPTPPSWITTPVIEDPKGVKQADPDIVIFNTESISPEFLVEVNYEDLSGMELINISRSDLINGINVAYSPIKNLSALRRRYNPNNIISMPESSSSFFARFGIDLVLRGIRKPFFDEEGNLVIEIDDVKNDELIDIEISQSGTINEVEFL